MTTKISSISGVSSGLTVNGNTALLAPLGITTTPALAPISITSAPALVTLGLMAHVMVAVPKEPVRVTVRSTVEGALSGSATCIYKAVQSLADVRLFIISLTCNDCGAKLMKPLVASAGTAMTATDRDPTLGEFRGGVRTLARNLKMVLIFWVTSLSAFKCIKCRAIFMGVIHTSTN